MENPRIIPNDPFLEIKVIQIDREALSKEIDEDIKKEIKKTKNPTPEYKIKEGEFFRVSEFAIVKSKSGKLFVTDNECVHEPIKDNKFQLNVRSVFCDKDGKRKAFGILPRFTVTMDNIEELIQKYGTETTMAEYMGDRLRYNSRIENNMNIFLKSMEE